MNTFIFLDVQGNLLGYDVVVSKNTAANGAESCSIVCYNFLHNAGFLGGIGKA
jgi:hypothetical protein